MNIYESCIIMNIYIIFVVGVILFRVAAAVDSFTDLLVAAAPVVVLAG